MINHLNFTKYGLTYVSSVSIPNTLAHSTIGISKNGKNGNIKYSIIIDGTKPISMNAIEAQLYASPNATAAIISATSDTFIGPKNNPNIYENNPNVTSPFGFMK